MEATTKLYSYNLFDARTYIFTALFVVGNILLPQLCHLLPQGGLMLLPIYFFTLVGAYKYGIGVGMLTAVFSPFINNVLFYMPAAEMLPLIVTKSIILAIMAAFVARRSGTVNILTLTIVILSGQLFGTAAELFATSSFPIAIRHLYTGIPGILLQIFGGYAVLKYALKK